MAKEKKTINSKSGLSAIFLILITILTIGLSYLLYDNHLKNKKLEQYTTQLASLKSDNDSISLSLDDEINKLEVLNLKYQELDEENLEIKNLITELVKEKENWKERSKLDHEELLTLREKIQRTILKFNKERMSYNDRIDSLTQSATKLASINLDLKLNNDSLAAASNNQLVINKEIIKKASKLNTENFRLALKNTKGKTLTKEPYKNKQVDAICSTFNISKNNITEQKIVQAVMRIEKPNGGILHDASANGNTFLTSSNLEHFYTVSTTIEFNNNYEEVSLTYSKNEELTSGEYYLSVYLDSEKIKEASFNIK